MTTRDETIGQLLKARETAHADLLNAAQADPRWRSDRIDEILWCNRQLERLGAIPAL